jgi:class 3 adenylate cyclase/WD40 repeat protein
MSGLPSGTVTFLFTDIEGSTRLLRRLGERYVEVLGRHDRLVRSACGGHGGREINTQGDAFFVAFARAGDAVAAAVRVQRALAAERWPEGASVRVRIGVHTGEPVVGGTNYVGLAVHRAARICAVGHGGQILLSSATRELLEDDLRSEVSFRDLGEWRLKDFDRPEHLFQVVVGDLPDRFPPPASTAAESRQAEEVELPLELDAGTPLAGRQAELDALREQWRRAHGGSGRLVLVAGARGMGKTRLAAEFAGEIHRDRGAVLYAAGAGAKEAALDALRAARVTRRPALLVLDDVDLAGDDVLVELGELVGALPGLPVLVVATAEQPDLGRGLGADEAFVLAPLDVDGVRAVARLYAGEHDDGEIPFKQLAETSGGVPLRVHRAAVEWARTLVVRRLAETASRIAADRPGLREAEDDLAASIVELHAGERAEPSVVVRESGLCPFKGLAPFDVDDAGVFFGRERLVAEMVARLTGAPLMGIVGPSGSGKSSVLRAGLLAALVAGVLPGSERWALALLRPGEHPMQALEDATAGVAPGGRLVIAVDQFEEVFTACGDATERGAFVDALVAWARDPRRRVVVLAAVRADFYGRCTAYPELARLLGANHVLVGPMQPDELRRAIELPARRAGLRVEPELVDALVADVADEPGALPLLSSALLELWQERDGRCLRHATYERTGGVRGAIARLAEEAFSELDAGQQRIARSLLLRLAGEGAGGAVVRRRVALTELEGQSDQDLWAVLDVLSDRRLITMSATTVEVAHEALLREWPRLRGWLEEDAQGRRVQRHLVDAAHDWDERGRDPGDLYRGARLAVALEWRSGHELELNPTERGFLDAGRAAAERAQRRLRVLLAGVAALLAVAVAGALVAVHQRSAARSEAQAAEAQRIGAQALTDPDLDRSLLLARHGVALDDAPATRSNLLAALVRAPAATGVMHAVGNPLTAIDVDSDGRTVAVGDSRGSVVFLDALTRRRIGQPVKPGLLITAVRFSPDGTRVAVAGHDVAQFGFVELFDARTHRSLRRLATGFESSAPLAFVGEVGTVVFSPDSHVLVADIMAASRRVNARRYAVRWDARTGRRLGSPRPLTSGNTWTHAVLGVGAGGRRLVTFSPGRRLTVVRDAVTLRQVREFRGGGTPVHELRGGGSPTAVSANGRTAAFALPDGPVRLLDLRTGDVRMIGQRNGVPVVAMRFTPDSRKLVTALGNAPLVVWDVEHATPLETFTGLGTVEQFAIASNGRTAYGVGHDDSVIAWDLTGTQRLGREFHSEPPTATGVLAVTARGTTFAVPDRGGYVDLRDSRDLTHTRRVRISAGGATRGASSLVAIAPDGRTLATATADGAISFVDLRSGQPLGRPVLAHVGKVRALAFSNDGRWLATGGADQAVYLWDVRRRRPVRISSALTGPPTSLSISPDDSEVAATVVGPDGNGLLDILSMPRLTLAAHRPAIAGRQTQFSHDGRRLFYGDDAGRVWVLDTRTWKPRGPPLAGRAAPGRFALSPDDRALATTAADGSTQLWQVPSGRPIGTALPGVAGRPVSAAFIDGGTELVTLHDNGQGYVWDLRPETWARRACAIAGRALTRTEWHDALPERHYQPACSDR